MKKLIAIAVIAFILSSCGTSKPYHACGITEWNKQHQIQCKSTKKPWFKRNR